MRADCRGAPPASSWYVRIGWRPLDAQHDVAHGRRSIEREVVAGRIVRDPAHEEVATISGDVRPSKVARREAALLDHPEDLVLDRERQPMIVHAGPVR